MILNFIRRLARVLKYFFVIVAFLFFLVIILLYLFSYLKLGYKNRVFADRVIESIRAYLPYVPTQFVPYPKYMTCDNGNPRTCYAYGVAKSLNYDSQNRSVIYTLKLLSGNTVNVYLGPRVLIYSHNAISYRSSLFRNLIDSGNLVPYSLQTNVITGQPISYAFAFDPIMAEEGEIIKFVWIPTDKTDNGVIIPKFVERVGKIEYYLRRLK